jgi:hypothetical protein
MVLGSATAVQAGSLQPCFRRCNRLPESSQNKRELQFLLLRKEIETPH